MSVAGFYSEVGLAAVYTDTSGMTRVRESFLITPSFGAVWYTDFDLGYPSVRDAVSVLPGASGTYDETKYHGARSISMTVTVLERAYDGLAAMAGWDPSVQWESASFWLDQLASWMHPERRYRLYYRRVGGSPRWVDVRPASMSAPVAIDTQGSLAVQLQWVGISGKAYSWNDTYSPDAGSDVQTATRDGRYRKRISVTGNEAPGRVYPETAPYVRDYPEGRGANSVVYQGSATAGMIIEIRSELTSLVNPRVSVYTPMNDLSGTVGFNYTVGAGDFIRVDTIERTATLNGDPDLLLNRHLIAPTSWPVLTPGSNRLASTAAERTPGYNRIVFAADSYSSKAVADVLYYDAFVM